MNPTTVEFCNNAAYNANISRKNACNEDTMEWHTF